mgnify:CR=1 FL=1
MKNRCELTIDVVKEYMRTNLILSIIGIAYGILMIIIFSIFRDIILSLALRIVGIVFIVLGVMILITVVRTIKKSDIKDYYNESEFKEDFFYSYQYKDQKLVNKAKYHYKDVQYFKTTKHYIFLLFYNKTTYPLFKNNELIKFLESKNIKHK